LRLLDGVMDFDCPGSIGSERSESGDWESTRRGGGGRTSGPASSSESMTSSALLYGSLVSDLGLGAGAETGGGSTTSLGSGWTPDFFLGLGRPFFSFGGPGSVTSGSGASPVGRFRFAGFFLDSAGTMGAGGGGSDDDEDAKKLGGWSVVAIAWGENTCNWLSPSSVATR